MNSELQNQEVVEIKSEKHPVFQVTKTSKYLALLLFVLLPFIGGWVGYTYAPEKIIELPQAWSLETNTLTLPVVDNSNDLHFQEGTYAVGRSRHVDGNEWFDTSIFYSPDRGYTWERYLSVYDGMSSDRVYVLYGSLYFSTVENFSSATGTISNFYKVDLSSKEKTLIGQIEGHVSDYGVTPQGVIVVVPTNKFCLLKAINCTSEVFNLEQQQTTSFGIVKGAWIEAYGNQGLVLGGGYGDAGCRSRELYQYQRTSANGLILQDEFQDAACLDDEDYAIFAATTDQKSNEFSKNIDPYYKESRGNSFELDTTEALKNTVKETELDRIKLADSDIGYMNEGTITVLQHNTIQDVSAALSHFSAEAQTSIPDFNLDEDVSPRDLLYPDGGRGKKMPMLEVAKFNSPEHCLVVYKNGVHDITSLLRLDYIFAEVSLLRDKCGTDIDEFITTRPVQAGSLNTARFAYAMSTFWIGYWVEG